MRTIKAGFAVVILLSVAWSCSSPEQEATDDSADLQSDEEAVKAWYDLRTQTINSGDFEGLRALFTEDVIFMPPGGALVQGWDAYEQWAKPFFDTNNVHEDITYEEVGVFGDRAFMRTSYRMTSTPKTGGDPTLGAGKAIWLFRRQADGTWKGSHCIWNTNE